MTFSDRLEWFIRREYAAGRASPQDLVDCMFLLYEHGPQILAVVRAAQKATEKEAHSLWELRQALRKLEAGE